MAEPFKSRAEKRRERQQFNKATRAENQFSAYLRAVANHIGSLVRGILATKPLEEATAQIYDMLRQYSVILQPWAKSVVAKMLADVARRDELEWADRGREMGLSLRKEIRQAPIGELLRGLLNEAVPLITSLPVEAAQRVHKLTLQGITNGERKDVIAASILRTGLVTRGRANLIARTEVARTASLLTQVRAEHVGSEGYIWRTAMDEVVRPATYAKHRVNVENHRKMEGVFVRWDTKPYLGAGVYAHAGQRPNCRCYPEVVIPELTNDSVRSRATDFNWEESKHSRAGKGQHINKSRGGEFVSKGGGGAAASGETAAPEPPQKRALRESMKTAEAMIRKEHPDWNTQQVAKELIAKHGGEASQEKRQQEAEIFVSPNVEENLNFDQARKAIHSEAQHFLKTMAQDVAKQVDHGAEVTDAVGDWSDGAENSLVIEPHTGDWEQTRYMAALLASKAKQKAVIPFVPRLDGKDSLWTLKVNKDMAEVREDLQKQGIEFRTLAPQPDGTRIYVYDPGSALTDKLEKLGALYGRNVEQIRGQGEFLGGDTRDEGQSAYQKVIAEYERGHQPYRGSDSGVRKPGVHHNGSADS